MPRILVMNAMHFRTLEDIPNPLRRLDVRVIEKLSDRRAERINRPALQTQSQDRIDQHAPNEGIDDHLQRMLVKRRDDLNTLRTMVYLVEHQPKPIHPVPPSMPP